MEIVNDDALSEKETIVMMMTISSSSLFVCLSHRCINRIGVNIFSMFARVGVFTRIKIKATFLWMMKLLNGKAHFVGQQCLHGCCCTLASCSSVIVQPTYRSWAVISPSRWCHTVTHPSLCIPYSIRLSRDSVPLHINTSTKRCLFISALPGPGWRPVQ